MYFFGSEFIISSLLWLFAVAIFIFLFKEQIKKFFYRDSPFELFVVKLKSYLEKTYPDISFDYSIIKKTKSEPNPDARMYIVIEHIIEEYFSLFLDESKYPNTTPQNLQWGSYVFNCEPNKNKLPNDWGQRKQALLLRDGKKCFRCSKHLDIDTVQIHMIKSLSENGKYNLENLIPICKDCEHVLKNEKTKHLDIKEDLEDIVKESI
ncbi:MAG: HNH endonuclease signature motif containing protein [Campylobacterota bacterium]|nr:HNH endonuclease signature motif containing protein [Campylobacterota bacterium]